MPIGDEVKAKDVVFSLKNSILTLGVNGGTTAIDNEELWDRVNPDDAWWEIDERDGQRCVVLELEKKSIGNCRQPPTRASTTAVKRQKSNGNCSRIRRA